MSRLQERIADAKRNFAANTAAHELTVLRDDGLYRHLRMRAPGTALWGWDIVTWPGYLTIVGDIGGGHVFARESDMIEFFANRTGSISADYWAEKIVGDNSPSRYSRDLFLDLVRESLGECADLDPELRDELLGEADEVADDETAARDLLAKHPDLFGHDAWWEWELRELDFHFLRSCAAIAATCRRYLAERSRDDAASPPA